MITKFDPKELEILGFYANVGSYYGAPFPEVAPDVVEAAVVALADHRVDAAGGLADVGVLIQHILHQRCLHSNRV